MRVVLIIAVTSLLIGCTKTEDGKEGPTRSAVRDVTETMTGYRSIQHGKQAQERIKKIDAAQKAQNDAVLNEM